MGQKKAQITLFILIGLVILFLVLLLLYGLRKEQPEEQLELQFDRATINNFIVDCLKDTSEKGLVIIGKQGGYLDPKSYITSEKYKIAYLYDLKTSKVPSKKAVEVDLAGYIDENMLICLKNFADFERQGWRVTYEAPKSTVQLNERDITVTQQFLVSVQKETALTFDEFSTSVPVRMLYLLNITNEIVAFHQAEPEWTDLTALSEHDVDITIFPYKKKLMYSIKDPQSSIKSESYLFNFALNFG